MSDTIQANIKNLIESRKSLFIASLNQDSLPEVSATPFLNIDHSFYIFISELASHTQNIRTNPTLSVMLIEDESDTKNAFSRKRLSYECIATHIERDDKTWIPLLDKFEEKQGKTISLLKQLPDFHLFELKAISGNYIEGFGKAYHLSGNNLNNVVLKVNS